MKTIYFSGLILLILALLGCSEKLHELEVDTSNGKTTFKTSKFKETTGAQENQNCNQSGNSPNYVPPNSSQYIEKGKALIVRMKNISPNDSLVLSVSEQDVSITGDQSTLFTNELDKIKSNGTTSNPAITNELEKKEEILNESLEKINETEKILEKAKESQSNYEKGLSAKTENFNQTELNELKKVVSDLESNVRYQEDEAEDAKNKRDTSLLFVSEIKYTQNELAQLSEHKKLIKNVSQRTTFLAFLQNSHQVCLNRSANLLSKNAEYPILSAELTHLLYLFKILKSEIESLVFEREKPFFPSKEEFTVSIKKYQRGSKTSQAEELIHLTFIQYKRFKIFSSAGMHCMIYNGKYAGIYNNKDSIIVRGNGDNIVPSFGTYLNGTWRLNDCLMGIALGMGIPLQFNSNVDMTPNFNVLWTTNFQNQYGRFGINAGFGIQKVNVLAPGFKVGDNLGTSNLDVPLRAIWTPTFGIGISYNLGDRE